MLQRERDDWQKTCRQEGIDPDEVRLVFERYEAYRQFMIQRAGETISLDRWFHFYRQEKASEGVLGNSVPGACSADGQAASNSFLENPVVFLRVLTACEEAGGDRTRDNR